MAGITLRSSRPIESVADIFSDLEFAALHHLSRLSFAIIALGVLTLVAASVASLSPLWTLIGLMLLVAGIVKVVIVLLWRFVGQLDDPIHPDEA